MDAYTIEQYTLNLMEDVWASTHLSPEVVIHPTKGGQGVFVKLVDADDPAALYYVDNGSYNLPNGLGLRASYGVVDGPDLFTVNNLPGDPVTWQQKAVEPLVEALLAHRSHLLETATDSAWDAQRGIA